MKHHLKKIFIVLLAVIISMPVIAPSKAKAFDPNYIIMDSIYENSSSMSSAQIDSFLNSFASSCISTNNGYTTPDPLGFSSGAYQFGSNVSGGKAIYDIAQIYHLNPQVILATLQKEQSIPTGAKGCHYDRPNPTDPSQIFTCTIDGRSQDCTQACPFSYGGGCMNIAMGYDCPGNCAANKETTSKQLSWGTWVLRWAQKRAYGILTGYPGYDSGDEDIWYYGPMTPGSRQRSSSDTSTSYDGTYTTNDGTSVTITNGATASLYNYTPFVSGNTSFSNTFTSWFGNPVTPCLSNTTAPGGAGPQIVSYKIGGVDRLAYTQLNATGSGCAEVHVWNRGFTSWLTHIATGMRDTDPSWGIFVPSVSRIDGQSSLNFVTVGNVEVHRLSPNLMKFPGYYDVPTNLNGNTWDGSFVAGNFFGNGYDYIAYILHAGTNGGMEIHLFDQTLTKAVGFYDLPTDIGAVNNGRFVAGDFLGRGYAQLAYVSYGNTEVHLFDIRGGTAKRIYEVPTNLANTDPSTGTFVAGDFLGIGHAQLVYVIYNNGSSVETHMFDNSLTKVNGTQDVITNMAGFNP